MITQFQHKTILKNRKENKTKKVRPRRMRMAGVPQPVDYARVGIKD